MALLDGKVVVIIGGTSGLGLSAAKAILHAGGRVVAVGREDEHLGAAENALGAGSVVIGADANEPAVAPAAIARAVDQLARVMRSTTSPAAAAARSATARFTRSPMTAGAARST